MNQKTVIITGAAKGIGAACAKTFEAQRLNLGLLDAAFPGEAEEAASKISLRCDVSVASEVKRSVEAVYRKFGRIDWLINNAGIQRYGSVTGTTLEEWDEVMNVNLRSQFLCAKYAIPYMQERHAGVIVNIASVQAFISQKNVAAYATAKSAILGLTRCIAIDYAPEIRCVAVCPGSIDTPMLRDAVALADDPEAVMQENVDMHLTKRIGTPEEVAALVAFLCEDKAAFITGQAIRIDGGLGLSIPGSGR